MCDGCLAYHTRLWKQTKDKRIVHLDFLRVERSCDVGPALEEAFSADRPCVLTIPIDYRENALLTQRLGEIACPIRRFS